MPRIEITYHSTGSNRTEVVLERNTDRQSIVEGMAVFLSAFEPTFRKGILTELGGRLIPPADLRD